MLSNTINQPFEMIGYRMDVRLGQTDTIRFFSSPQPAEPTSTTGISGLVISDAVAFEEALDWVLGEYGDVLRKLAA
jgi:hypothetical protein